MSDQTGIADSLHLTYVRTVRLHIDSMPAGAEDGTWRVGQAQDGKVLTPSLQLFIFDGSVGLGWTVRLAGPRVKLDARFVALYDWSGEDDRLEQPEFGDKLQEFGITVGWHDLSLTLARVTTVAQSLVAPPVTLSDDFRAGIQVKRVQRVADEDLQARHDEAASD